MAYTRAQVRELIRQRCDLENTTAQQDTEINNHINGAAEYCHKFLISTYGNRYDRAFSEFNTVAGTDTYALASVGPTPITDMFNLIAIKLHIDDLLYPLGSFEHMDSVTASSSSAWGPGYLPRYELLQQADSSFILVFNPPPDGVYHVHLAYHPTAPVYTLDADVVGIPHVDLLVMEACIRVKDKEERDASRFMQEREKIQKTIEDWAHPIDHANPAQTIRVASGGRVTWRPDRVF